MSEAVVLIDSCKKLKSSGILAGTAGNLSVRCKGDPSCFLITPSGVDYDALVEQSIVKIHMETGRCEGKLKPSIEKDLHRSIYLNRPDVNAVVHTHSTFCTAMACVNKSLPVFNVESVSIGNVPLVRYECPGSIELAEAVSDTLKGHRCALMANHGMISTGSSIGEALYFAILLENCCKTYVMASTVGEVVPLSSEQIQKAISMLKSYGQ